MGTSFHRGNQSTISPGPAVHPSGLNMMARAFGAPAYGAQRAAGTAGKDLAAAAAFSKGGGLPVKKSAATDAPGPKV